MKETCSYCGVETERIEGETHNYMLSSPGCWATFGEVLAREYSDVNYMKVHRLTVDAYACQHVGNDEPRANQSVSVHLLALFLAFEKRLEFSQIPKHMQEIITLRKGDFQRLEPPDFSKALNVGDVVRAQSADEHCALIRNWAKQVWQLWAKDHEYVAELAGLVL